MEKGFKYAKLILDEPRAVYYAGQLLTGHIECELVQPIQYTVINITYKGEANVHWSEWEMEEYNGVRRDKQVKYNGHEEYFNITQCIGGGQGVTELPPGTHTIPFSFQVPYFVPSTFKADRGQVTYSITVYIEYPDARVDRDVLMKEFEVVTPLDLNMSEDVQRPMEIEFEEFYSCCCSSSPMNVSIRLPASGYCPGQTIPININAHNDTNFEVQKIVFQLIKRECYHSLVPPSDYIPPEVVLVVVKTGPILSKTQREFSYDMVVPDMIAPNLEKCSIIDVGFFFKVTIKLSGCNDDIEDESEICLGLVPLTSSQNAGTYKHPMAHSLPTSPIPIPPPAEMCEQNTVNAHQNKAAPYQNPPPYSVEPYPNSAGPYPNSTGPYPNSTGPYPNSTGPYPNSTGPYPNSTGPYPNSTGPYPSSVPYPNAGPGMNSQSNIGFVMPSSPYGPASYPMSNISPYPTSVPHYDQKPSAPPS